MGDLTKNFSRSEFECGCCGASDMDPEFMEKLQAAREILDFPMYPTSGFRCKDHNRAVGGVPGSFHMLGRAADFSIADLHIRAWMAKVFLDLELTVGINKRSLIHVDNRPEQIIFGY